MAKVYDIKSFESHLISRGLAENSVKAFVSDIRQFLESDLDPESFLEDLKRKGCTNSTLMRKRASLINYYKFKEEPLNLAPIRVNQPLPFVLTQPEAKALLEEASRTRNSKRDRLLIELMLRAGLRLGEVLGLVGGDVVEDNGITFIIVRHTKGKKDRRIPIVDKGLVRLLRGYVRGIPVEDRIFDISRRRVELLVKDLAKRAGIRKPIHPHTLRHTAATLYLKNGTNIESIRRMLGHASLSTTQKYLQLTDEEVAKDLSRANW
ncbi:tyrosine-type recombinase/integrase [Athalassotoga saccharophila]|uniref:Tyrosine recombinase XerD n=1 Tax=Athalassotoga saccharophila TaxID=1441386 RepID=A0A6N4TEL7_9BACT|nr:tyrosine-type recombinase/integrase [Athalassotoga saccharophila]BBJ29111.1 tyrosine recombinase XerD [Athalassotoga saccharophila]